jgi:hypothetical protein
MEEDQPFKFISGFYPLQILLLLNEEELKNRNVIEKRELEKVKEMHKEKSIKEIIRLYHVDYRIVLYNTLNFLESPDYLLNLKCCDRLTNRQLDFLLVYIFRYVLRNSVEMACKIMKIVVTQDKSLVRQLINDLFNDPNYKLDYFESRAPIEDVEATAQFNLRPASELCDLFSKYMFVSNNLTEAKAICVGLGLHQNTNWFKNEDYQNFIELLCNRTSNNFLFKYKVEGVLEPYIKKTLNVKNPCIICFDRNINRVFKPCNHAALCEICSTINREFTDTCVICRMPGEVEKLFIVS